VYLRKGREGVGKSEIQERKRGGTREKGRSIHLTEGNKKNPLGRGRVRETKSLVTEKGEAREKPESGIKPS